jgi:hypothetical protein
MKFISKTLEISKEVQKIALVASLAICSSFVATQSASAGWWEDIVTPNIDRARSETVGRAFNQTYVAELSSEYIDRLKASQGGDWPATVTDWCNNEVAQRASFSVSYLTSTWRVEGNKVNCYARTLWYK